jgi:hypothetical protein
MIIDGLLRFSQSQALTSSTTGTTASTNVIDLLNARDMGIGDDPALKLAIYVGTGFSTTDSATLQIQAQGSTDNATFTTYAESRAYTSGELTTGAKLFPIDWPHRGPGDALPRYLRLAYVMGTLSFTAGVITADLVIDRQDATQYPAGINITN